MAVKRSRKTRKAARKIKIARKPAGQRGKIIKSSNLKSDHDLGKLALRPYFDAKRTAKQVEIKEYEKKYLARYKQPKANLKNSKSYLQILEEPKRDIKKERKDYEKEFLSRYKKKSKTDQKKRASKQLEWKPKPSIKQKRGEYEKEYVTRYSKQQKAKPKKKVFAIR